MGVAKSKKRERKMESNQNKTTAYRPDKVYAIAILSLLNGIVNIIWGIVITIGALATIVGICCVPITILPIVLGILEIIYASKLLSTPPRPCQPNQTIAILDIICILYGNFISLVVGILLLVFYSDLDVKEWFNTLCKEDQVEDLPLLEI